MKTLTINTAGQRATAYFTEDVSRKISLNGKKIENITVKEAKKITKNMIPWHEGVNYKTFKIS